MSTARWAFGLVSTRTRGYGEEIIHYFQQEDLPAKRGKQAGPGASARPASPSFTGNKKY